ncbi:MAG: hypothetical protein ACO3NK_09250 [Prochlorotrichaceae cyanobacterium]|jgi:hypothetical protein
MAGHRSRYPYDRRGDPYGDLYPPYPPRPYSADPRNSDSYPRDDRYDPPPPPQRWRFFHPSLYYWGLILALVTAIALFWDPGRVFSRGSQKTNRDCQEVVQPQAVLSRENLAQLLTIPERDPRQRVRTIVQEPYCLLPSITIRAGVTAVREAYPLEFDPDTWLIILYEGEEYAGYRFIYR